MAQKLKDFKMPVNSICKNCNKIVEPYMIKTTEKVFCSECNCELTVTHFVKMQLKSLRQYKEEQSQKSFAVKCSYCGLKDRPIILMNDIVCSACNKPIKNISLAFKNMLKSLLLTADKDVN
jgi:hypothetical protein